MNFCHRGDGLAIEILRFGQFVAVLHRLIRAPDDVQFLQMRFTSHAGLASQCNLCQQQPRQPALIFESRFDVASAAKSCYRPVMANMAPKLHRIRGLMGWCHLLSDGNASVMIDTGLVGEPFLIRRLVRRLGLQPNSIKAILLTHGHLDHAGNLAWLKAWTGAKVLAHRDEQAHVDGQYPYHGITKWCGRLEAAGRFLFRYRPATIDEFLNDGQDLPFWGGLRVIHLPGHTAGHCGFYSAKHDLLFIGDMFVSYFFSLRKPPAFLNSVPELLPGSVEKIRRLNPGWIVPNHYDFFDGALHRRRFAKLYGLEWPTAK